MIYYADKNGKFIGGSNHGVKPDGTVFETEAQPDDAETQIYSAKDDAWLPAVADQSTQEAKSICQGVTKAGNPCRNHASHGNYCYQHRAQG